jgi:anaerobic selenocysteine-containing dehydrogenase
MINDFWHKTACNLCYINCGVEVLVSHGRIEKVRGDRSTPKSQGYMCHKAARIPYYAHHQDRLTKPLRRRPDGGFDEIEWDVAIAEISTRLKALLHAHGPACLALYGGGGQGNHAGGGYATSFIRALGSRTVFNALSQEKTGDFWVNGHMFGSQTCHTAEDIHHCDLLLVIGANPWIAHGFPNARDHLNKIRNDPDRRLVVIDPRRSETAEMADLHLAVRPGTDTFLLGALLAMLVRSDTIDHDFLAKHTTGYAEIKQALLAIPVVAWAAAAEISMVDLERCAEMIREAKAMVVRVELGIQQGVNSTLNSYLEKLLILLSGNFGRKGTNQLHSWLLPLWGNSVGQMFVPVEQEIIGGLLPPNIFPEAILADHPDRLRVAWIDSSNPANTAANTSAVERALLALDLCVVVDVAMTETAQLAHYVLPAASQYEKTEFTLFNFDFPTNYFHVRAPVLTPLEGTLTEPEIYTRLAQTIGILPSDDVLAPVREAALRSRAEFVAVFRAFMAENPAAVAVTPLVLFNTLGASLPDGVAAAAPLWSGAMLCAKRSPQAVRRAIGVDDDVPDEALGDLLFDAVVSARQGIAFTEHDYDEVWSLIAYPDRKIRLNVPGMLDWLARLDPSSTGTPKDYPFTLAAGQRRKFNANQIFRNPAWRREDPDGALLANSADLDALGASEGEWIAVESTAGRLVARCKVDDSLRTGQLALPHGYGQSYPTADGRRLTNGPRINILTDSGNRDPIAGTPYHKHVAVRLLRLSETESAQYQSQSEHIHQITPAE